MSKFKKYAKRTLIGYYAWCYLLSVNVSGYNQGANFAPWNSLNFVATLIVSIPLGVANMALYPVHLLTPSQPPPENHPSI